MLLTALVRISRAFPTMAERIKEVVAAVIADKSRTERMERAIESCYDGIRGAQNDIDNMNKSRM